MPEKKELTLPEALSVIDGLSEQVDGLNEKVEEAKVARATHVGELEGRLAGMTEAVRLAKAVTDQATAEIEYLRALVTKLAVDDEPKEMTPS